MQTWLEKIQEELDAVDLRSMSEPSFEVRESDHVVGEVDPKLRRLYVLAQQYGKAAEESMVEARYAHSEELREHHSVRAQQASEKSKLLMEIFWVSLQEAFELWHKNAVGLRKGWTFVWFESGNPGLGDILGQMFRGRD